MDEDLLNSNVGTSDATGGVNSNSATTTALNSTDTSPGRVKDRELKLKLLKEKQEQDYARKLAEMKLAQEREDRLVQKKEEERLLKIREHKSREEQHRNDVIERKRKLELEQEVRRKEMQSKLQADLAAKPAEQQKRSDKPNYAFGSSAPRTFTYLENLDASQRIMTNKLVSSAQGGAANDSVSSETGARAASACSLSRKALAYSSSDINSPTHRARSNLSNRRPAPPPSRLFAPTRTAATPQSTGSSLAGASSMTASYCAGDYGNKNVRQKVPRVPALNSSRTVTTPPRTVNKDTVPKKPPTRNVTSIREESTDGAAAGSSGRASRTATKPPVPTAVRSAPPVKTATTARDSSNNRPAAAAVSNGAAATDKDGFKRPLPPKAPVAKPNANAATAHKRPSVTKPAPEAAPPLRGRSANRTPTVNDHVGQAVNRQISPPVPVLASTQAPVTPVIQATAPSPVPIVSPEPSAGSLQNSTPVEEPGLLPVVNDSVLDGQTISVPNDGLGPMNERPLLSPIPSAVSGEDSSAVVAEGIGRTPQKGRTEEEAKAALAEKRRIAREEQERQRKLQEEEEERQRLAEEERLRQEEEEFRRQEEEASRAAAERQAAEEERLRLAIEEAEKRKEIERQKEEEERIKKEESDRIQREQQEKAEKERLEREEKLRKEDEERAERKKRMEALLNKTRKQTSAIPESNSSTNLMSASMYVPNDPAPAATAESLMSKSTYGALPGDELMTADVLKTSGVSCANDQMPIITNGNGESSDESHHPQSSVVNDDVTGRSGGGLLAANSVGGINGSVSPVGFNSTTLTEAFHTPLRSEDVSLIMTENDSSFSSAYTHFSTPLSGNSGESGHNNTTDNSLLRGFNAMTLDDSFGMSPNIAREPMASASTPVASAPPPSDGLWGEVGGGHTSDANSSMDATAGTTIDAKHLLTSLDSSLLENSQNLLFNGNNNASERTGDRVAAMPPTPLSYANASSAPVPVSSDYRGDLAAFDPLLVDAENGNLTNGSANVPSLISRTPQHQEQAF